MKSELVKGDSLKVLKKYEDNSVDLLCTDPPYGYGFMGRDWDKVLPDVGIFEECFRVLKPGSMAFVMSAPRSDVQYRMAEMLEKVGFRIDYTPIYWTYASGFPKAMNMGKMLDKVGRDKKELDGSYAGFQPKPAVEVVIVAMKPLDKKGYLEQAEDNGKGVTWFDDCRIPFADDDYDSYVEKQISFKGAKTIGKTIKGDEHFLGGDIKQLNPATNYQKKDGNETRGWNNSSGYGRDSEPKTTKRKPRTEGSVFKESGFKSEDNDTAEANPMGRFPANLLVSDDVLDDGKKRKAVPKGGFGAMDIGIGKPGEKQKYRKKKMTMPDLRDVGKKSKEAIGIDKLSFGQVEKAERKDYEMWDIQEDDIGYSRLFSLDTWFSKNIKQLPEPVQKTFPFMIVPKASRGEKDEGLELMEEKKAGAYVGRGGTQEDPNGMFKDRDTKRRNVHPTVKPLMLMNYLVTLGSRKGDMVLDPFMGSGTTPLACISLERKYIGIDNEEEYYEIAKARVDKLEYPLKMWEKFS
jgi:DNA modification methylase